MEDVSSDELCLVCREILGEAGPRIRCDDCVNNLLMNTVRIRAKSADTMSAVDAKLGMIAHLIVRRAATCRVRPVSLSFGVMKV